MNLERSLYFNCKFATELMLYSGLALLSHENFIEETENEPKTLFLKEARIGTKTLVKVLNLYTAISMVQVACLSLNYVKFGLANYNWWFLLYLLVSQQSTF